MAGRILEMRLVEVKVEENGELKDEAGQNILKATLFYPREGITSLSTIKSLRLQDKTVLDLRGEPYYQTVLFKERINGNCHLIIEVAEVDKPPKIQKFFAAVLGTMVKTFLGGVKRKINHVILGGGVKGGTDFIWSELHGNIKPEDRVEPIGRGDYEFETHEVEPELIIPLTTPMDIAFKTLKRRAKDGKALPVEEVYRKRGTDNGYVVIACKYLDA